MSKSSSRTKRTLEFKNLNEPGSKRFHSSSDQQHNSETQTSDHPEKTFSKVFHKLLDHEVKDTANPILEKNTYGQKRIAQLSKASHRKSLARSQRLLLRESRHEIPTSENINSEFELMMQGIAIKGTTRLFDAIFEAQTNIVKQTSKLKQKTGHSTSKIVDEAAKKTLESLIGPISVTNEQGLLEQ